MTRLFRFWNGQGGLACVLAVLMTLLEWVKACRESAWAGSQLIDWMGTLGAAIAYAILIGAIAAILARLFARKRDAARLGGHAAVSLPPILAAAMLWAMLSRYRESVPTVDDAAVAGLLVGFGAMQAILPRWSRAFTHSRISTAAMLALITTFIAVAKMDDALIFSSNRPKEITLFTAVWLTAAMGMALIACGWPHARKAKWRHYGLSTLLVFASLTPGMDFPWHAAASPNPSGKQPPNLVLLVADAFRAESTSLCGGPWPTPHLNALASQGALFEKAFALAPWTLPSMMGLLTSTYPPALTPGVSETQHALEMWRYGFRTIDRPISELLQPRGYLTCALTANPLVSGASDIERGFTMTHASHHLRFARQTPFGNLPFLHDALMTLFPAWRRFQFHDSTADLNRAANRFLRRARHQPFYLWMHYMDPHAPYAPPQRFRAAKGPWDLFWPYPVQQRWHCPTAGDDCQPVVTPQEQAYVRSLYAGEIEYADEAVGSIIARLKSLGLMENTYVCFTSDHGEELWEHGAWGHGHSLAPEQIHVPLIMTGPGIPPQRLANPISAIDVTPTLAGCLSLDRPEVWQGQNWAAVIQGKTGPLPGQPCFSRATSQCCQQGPLEKVRTQDYALVRNVMTMQSTLFDVQADPGETQNIRDAHPDIAKQLEQLLDEWDVRFTPDYDAYYGADQPAPDPNEAIQQLRSQGYL